MAGLDFSLRSGLFKLKAYMPMQLYLVSHAALTQITSACPLKTVRFHFPSNIHAPPSLTSLSPSKGSNSAKGLVMSHNLQLLLKEILVSWRSPIRPSGGPGTNHSE